MPPRSIHTEPADDWVRSEVRAVLRGDKVEGYRYDTIGDLDEALAIFSTRQSAYDASIASGVRRLDELAQTSNEPGTWVPSRVAIVGKRIFDIVFATLLLVLLAPVLAVIAIAIKLDSRGPAFFRQLRVGQGSQHFQLFKFRSMVTDADDQKDQLRALNEASEGLFKITHDPRVTRVGAFLRRTSLDELPQLFNVLRGEMSFVGPPPLIVEAAQSISDPNRHPSLALKPGMTGVGQLAQGLSLEERVKLDDEYATHWSLLRDFAVLARRLAQLSRPTYD